MKIRYINDTINPEEVIKYISLTGQDQFFYGEIIKRKEVMRKAKELKLEVSDDQLQQLADNFRTTRGLHSADETLRFLERGGLTEEDFEAFCESTLLISAVRERMADEKKVEAYFVNNRSSFDAARISIIVVKDENLANEMVMQVTEEGEDFHALARRHSLDEATKYSGGYVGLISREMLAVELTSKVFNAGPGDLLGPFQKGGLYQVVLVEEVKKAELNEETKEAIKERIFEEWISQFWKDAIKVSL